VTSEHVFKIEITKHLDELFDGVNTWQKFWSNLRGLPLAIDGLYEHGLQFLMEAFVKHYNIATDYKTLTDPDDKKVHGEALNVDGERSAFGALYVLEKDEGKPLIAKDGLTSFLSHAQRLIKLDSEPSLPNTMFIFTNGPSLHDNAYKNWIEMQGLQESVIVFDRPRIQSKVDGDSAFWDFAKSLLKYSGEISGDIKPREFQIEASQSTKDHKKSQVLSPTGTGKTIIEAMIVENSMSGDHSVAVIACPRIGLAFQHLDEIASFNTCRGLDVVYVNLNSGNKDDYAIKEMMVRAGFLARDIPSTTSPQELQRIYDQCKFNGLPMLISSTYQSIHRLLDTNIPINLLICDEAHNLVGGVGRFSTEAQRAAHRIANKVDKTVFLTATQAFSPSDEGSGMQNVDLFGEVAYQLTPRHALELGEIVPPYIAEVKITEASIKKHKGSIVQLSEDEFGRYANIDSVVILESFDQLEELHYKYSCDPSRLGAKMLVSFRGEESFRAFFTSSYVNQWARVNHVNLYGVSSASGAFLGSRDYHMPATQGNFKEMAFLKMRQEPETSKMILGHIDMLGEGVDLPGLLGVLPLRDLGSIKAPQTIGRVMRLHPIDRQRFYAGEIDTSVLSLPPGSDERHNSMVKPYAWVMLPTYDEDKRDGRSRIVKIARQIRDEYSYTPFGMGVNSAADGRNEQFNKDPRTNNEEVDKLRLIYEIENPAYEEALRQQSEEAKNTPAKIMNLIDFSGDM